MSMMARMDQVPWDMLPTVVGPSRRSCGAATASRAGAPRTGAFGAGGRASADAAAGGSAAP